MDIQKILLNNFKCFKGEFALELNPGLNIIVGDNEAGKSTIIEAIHLALTGWFKGRYLQNELSQYLFNKEVVDEYLKSVAGGKPLALPSVTIEVYLNSKEVPILEGNRNSRNEPGVGFSLKIEFDDKYQDEYEILVKSAELKSLPIEYYRFYWESFAWSPITTKSIPIKSAYIDASSGRLQSGSDIYISRIVRDFLEPKEIVDVSQAHRKMKEVFMEEEAIKAINKKIQEGSKISHKKVELSVELSTRNSWESTLVTYLDDIPFHHVGKGEQSIVKTKLALSHKKALAANAILLEEPESHLSHSRLNGLITDIKANDETKQVVISTHSSFVANKLGLENLILLKERSTVKLTALKPDTYRFFEKLSGYDTLRLILCDRAILVEGDSDELIIQRAYADRHEGRLPIDDGVDVISVGTAFLRFLEIAELLNAKVDVVTDNDGSVETLEKKYENYRGDNVKKGIRISYDATVDSGDLIIGKKPFNYNTLEPKLLKVNDLGTFNQIFGTDHKNLDDIHRFMKSNKTECALKIFESDISINYPEYISEVL